MMHSTILGLPPRQHSRKVHWAVAKKWRSSAFIVCAYTAGTPDMATADANLRVKVTLTRVRTSGPEMDADNAAESLAHVRDGVCDALWRNCSLHAKRPCGHLHDDDKRIIWEVRQEKGSVALTDIKIEVV